MVRAGEKFGNYQVSGDSSGKVTILSETPDSITVRGEHGQLGTPVAIKILHHPTQGREAFDEEVRVAAEAAGLTHPHIARVLDFGSDDHELYRVTEWCEGGDLKVFGPSAEEPALKEWFLQAAEALAYAHREGVLHGALKLSNLLIARERGGSSIKITDFGFGGSAGILLKSSQAADAHDLAAIFAELLGSSGAGLPGTVLSTDPNSRPADGGKLLSLVKEAFAKAEQPPPAPPVVEEIPPPPMAAPEPPPPLPPIPLVEDIPPPLPAAISSPPSPPPVPVTVPQVEATPSFTPPPAPPAPRQKKSSPLPAIAALVVLVLLAGGGYLAWTRFKPSPLSTAKSATSPGEASPEPIRKEIVAQPAQNSSEIATNEGPPPVREAPAPESVSTPAESPAPVAAEDQPKVLKVPG
ncbi:MAG: hypothetical protein JWO82_938, partial [Akkermansiaceae bacterium]|nr:hypothetical protein [Akkermansiaceae bacterium]